MLLDWLGQHIMEEWAVVTAAPLLFVIAVLLFGIVIFLVLEWFHKEKVSTLEQRLSAKETQEWLALFKEKEALEHQVLELKTGLPQINFKSELKKQIVGMDEDDVRDLQITRKERRINELTQMMYAIQMRPKP